MDNVRMILCGSVEASRVNPSEKVGVVSVVFVSADEKQIKRKLEELQKKNERSNIKSRESRNGFPASFFYS